MKSQSKIILPRNYLSWSQMSLFESSSEQYKKKYIFGIEQPRNDYMDFGKKIADIMENGDDGQDEMISMLYCLISKYKVFEKEIKVKVGDISLLGSLDNFNPKTKDFKEYKTGKIKWTQRRVEKHGQLDFYATLIYLKYKVIPKDIELIWVETEDTPEGIQLTGNMKAFKTTKTLADILRFIVRIKKTSLGISNLYQRELKTTL